MIGVRWSVERKERRLADCQLADDAFGEASSADEQHEQRDGELRDLPVQLDDIIDMDRVRRRQLPQWLRERCGQLTARAQTCSAAS
jgi:hypothetical protein